MQVESDERDEGIILEEMRRGYDFKGKVLRPAMVTVAVKKAPAPPALPCPRSSAEGAPPQASGQQAVDRARSDEAETTRAKTTEEESISGAETHG